MDDTNDPPRSRASVGAYLKSHSEALIKDLGYERACKASGKSKATLGRYFSSAPEHADRYMPIDVVAALEEEATFPHVTKSLADLRMIVFDYDASRTKREGGLNTDVVRLSQRFATLMAEYNHSIEDGVITLNEAKRLLAETREIQQVLMEMKLHLEDETAK
ncbi:MAG: hypothetical protein AAF679_03940 [Pseudomonadota bacterium]